MSDDREALLAAARQVIEAGRDAIIGLSDALDERFLAAVELLDKARGRIVVTGIGKSGLVGAKIAATLSSTGTPALFLHTSDALHGDLGVVTKDDVVLAFSKSGRTAELTQLLPLLARLGVPVVALVADLDSPLARAARITLPLGRVRDAGPEDLIPTASTTAAMTLGDALAVALMHRRGFDARSLAFIHTGGLIGRQAGLTVAEIMHSGEALPAVPQTATLREALVEILGKKLGVTTVTGACGRLAGILTDGDLKRIFLSDMGAAALDQPVSLFMSNRPRTINREAPVAEAVRVMEDPAQGFVTSLVVIDDVDRAAGIVHLHDCLKPA
ncbi:MAG: KpsF/GutQ family sugar-phosphate isomerase [Candidatus Eisenbacteria bacterium]|nr:KpsF/GutQ family sugar-phosphate isomerase [Candidatus Eisenbacteria bacterium]